MVVVDASSDRVCPKSRHDHRRLLYVRPLCHSGPASRTGSPSRVLRVKSRFARRIENLTKAGPQLPSRTACAISMDSHLADFTQTPYLPSM
ncbi:hypothetical protein MJO28_010718 [Puccinia striiformis f. sp. tritici]|uniref:Uncharacterized protein n=1 Tax=Puccinia striiformis f. sp. tritici TaxID=168172 RepID=A0ACC0E8G4_9BASI|nr:hypothetical protein MJO28_017185 [Puccinia striiformis f. sp. tritici]KAI7945023.1 hypothetical protein MJO28_010718 [Puccinia striiformis f. sp. tritici]